MAISPSQFEQVRSLVAGASGIHLEPGMETRVESCLENLARHLKFGSSIEFFRSLEKGSIHDAGFLLSEAVADRDTSFFRDPLAFEALRKVILPELVQSRSAERSLLIWSAGCSSGQEPYSLAILLREHFPELAGWKIEIHAVDIAEDALETAKAGVYTQANVNRGVPAPLLLKHFVKAQDQWHLKDEVRQLVRYHQINLAEAWPELPPMDLILLRYVLSSWNKQTQELVLERSAKLLRPGGSLLIGMRETLPVVADWFEERAAGKTAVYVPKRRG